MQNRLPSVFISYSRKNNVFAKALVEDLKNLGTCVWVDYVEITVGDDLHDKIGEAIENVDFFCAVISEDSIKSSWVKDELRQAIETQREVNKKKVLPLKLDDCKIPFFLKGIVYADFTGSYENGLKELLRAINPQKYNLEKSLNTQLYDFFCQKAVTYLNNRENTLGQEALTKALAINSKDAVANFTQGQLLYNRGEILESESYFIKATTSENIINVHSFNYLADIERSKGLRNAILCLENSIPKGNNGFEVYYKLGELYRAIIIESYSLKDYELINEFETSKSLLNTDCRNAQKYLRMALFRGSANEERAHVLYYMKEILEIYIPNDKEFAFAYLDEYILEVEKFGVPEEKNYLDMIWFFGANYKFEIARHYAGKLLSKMAKNEDLLKRIDTFLKEREVEKENSFGNAQVLTMTALTFDAIKSNIYNQNIEYHPCIIDQTNIINKASGISIPLVTNKDNLFPFV